MKRTSLVGIGLAGSLILLVSSCSLLGLGSRDERKAAEAAGALLDYMAEEGMTQVQELETVSESYDLEAEGGQAANTRAVKTDYWEVEYRNFTVMVTRDVDDNGTDTPTDDIVTVTRETDFGFEENRIHVLVRPKRPTTDSAWDSYADGDGMNGWLENAVDRIDQSGAITNSLGDVQLSGGTVDAVWAREGDTVFAEQITREMSNAVRDNVIHRTIIGQSVDGETTLVREREVDGEVVHTYTVDEYTDPETGETYTRIIRDDDGYALVIARGNRFGEIRIVDYYNADGIRIMRLEEERLAPQGTIRSTRTHYDADGNVTGTRTVTYSINYLEDDEDAVQITRTVNGRTRIFTITESGEVYVVILDGETYRMDVVDANTVDFLDDSGNVVMTAERLPDGSWQVTTPGSEPVVVL